MSRLEVQSQPLASWQKVESEVPWPPDSAFGPSSARESCKSQPKTGVGMLYRFDFLASFVRPAPLRQAREGNWVPHCLKHTER